MQVHALHKSVENPHIKNVIQFSFNMKVRKASQLLCDESIVGVDNRIYSALYDFMDLINTQRYDLSINFIFFLKSTIKFWPSG